MSVWLAQHTRALQDALGKIAAQRAASLLNILVIAIALSLPAGGYVLLGNLQGVATRFSLEPQLSVFLEPAAKAADRDNLEKRLRSQAGVGALPALAGTRGLTA